MESLNSLPLMCVSNTIPNHRPHSLQYYCFSILALTVIKIQGTNKSLKFYINTNCYYVIIMHDMW